MPESFQTQLGRWFREDRNSPEEWQKIALPSFYANRGRYLGADEPTAAMDAEAEVRIFEHFARSLEPDGALISHRFRLYVWLILCGFSSRRTGGAGHPQGVVEGRRTLCPTLLAQAAGLRQLHGRSGGSPSYPLKPTNMIRAPITARIGSTSPVLGLPLPLHDSSTQEGRLVVLVEGERLTSPARLGSICLYPLPLVFSATLFEPLLALGSATPLVCINPLPLALVSATPLVSVMSFNSASGLKLRPKAATIWSGSLLSNDKHLGKLWF